MSAGRPARPVLVYDGECGFCTRSARLLERLGVDADLVAWQLVDLPALGLSRHDAAATVQWVDPDGAVQSGHEAIAAALVRAGGLCSALGRAMRLPGISPLAARLYSLVSTNRHRLPGGTPACELAPEQRPGAPRRGR